MVITAVMTGHREGLIAGPSLASFREAIDHARTFGLSIEPVIVLDRPDELTRAIFEEHGVLGARLVTTDYGDPALARMRGVAEGNGELVTFLDADDLWSFNWLTAACAFVCREGAKTIGHSELNIIFGGEKLIWLHADSTWPEFDFEYLRISNYWDALCVAARNVFESYPIHKNDLMAGHAHEDWHWNCLTYSAGYRHRPVPDTVHMKRRRAGSQSAHCNASDVVPWPTPLVKHAWTPP